MARNLVPFTRWAPSFRWDDVYSSAVEENDASPSGLALGLDQGGGDRFLRGLAGPEDELEYGVEALAFLDRGLDQGLGLLEREERAVVAFEQGGVAEEDEA